MNDTQWLRLRSISAVLSAHFSGLRNGKAQYVDGKCITPTIEQAENAAAALAALVENHDDSPRCVACRSALYAICENETCARFQFVVRQDGASLGKAL